MRKKLSILSLLALLLSVMSCDKSVPEPVILPVLVPESAPENPLISNIPLSGTYYLYRMSNFSNPNPTNFLPFKDSLTIKFLQPSSIEISMKLKKNINGFVDSCGIYTGIGKLNVKPLSTIITFGELNGKYYNYCTYCTNTYPIPYWNAIKNINANGDTLKLNLSYRYYIWTQGKPSGGFYDLDLTFVKVP